MEHGDSLLIGRIVGFHGVRGIVKVQCYIDSPAVFDDLNEIWIESDNGGLSRIAIEKIKFHKRNVLFSFQGIEDRDSAESLKGKNLFINQDRLPDLEDDEYYWKDLIGIKVFELESDSYIGSLKSIIQTGGNDVYVVKKEDEEILIPAIGSVVKSIDLDKNSMYVDLPEGLV